MKNAAGGFGVIGLCASRSYTALSPFVSREIKVGRPLWRDISAYSIANLNEPLPQAYGESERRLMAAAAASAASPAATTKAVRSERGSIATAAGGGEYRHLAAQPDAMALGTGGVIGPAGTDQRLE